MIRGYNGGFVSISIAAAISIALLLGALSWKLAEYSRGPLSPLPLKEIAPADVPENDTDKDGSPDWQEMLLGTNTEDPTSRPAKPLGISKDTLETATSTPLLGHTTEDLIGTIMSGYLTLKEQGSYTPERGEALAETIARNMRAAIVYEQYDANALKTTTDSSRTRIEAYRLDMQQAVDPLLSIKEPAFATFGRYFETADEDALADLQKTATAYRQAENSVRAVIVPEPAVSAHLDVLNALSFSASVIEAMAAHAKNPIAALELLRAYTDVERTMVNSFDALAQYFQHALKT